MSLAAGNNEQGEVRRAPVYTPDITPSDPEAQLRTNIAAADEPFAPQDISNEDLLGGSKNFVEEQPEPFEEVLESREMIEARIFSIKCRMMDFTLRQQDIQDKIGGLRNDIKILDRKTEETQGEQSTAIELEDYEKADTLDFHIKQTKKLIEGKEGKIKQL